MTATARHDAASIEQARSWLPDPPPLRLYRPIVPHSLAVYPLLLLAGLAQWAMLRPAIPSDAISYFGWAESIASNEISHGPTRLGVTVPVRVAIEVFGTSETAFHLVPVLMFLLMVGSLYALGTQLFGQPVGVLASLLLMSSTIVFEYSSHPLPDPFASSWFVAAMALLLARQQLDVGWRRDAVTVLGALLVGVGYLAREYVVLLAPVLLVLAWRQRWPRRDLLLVGATLLGVFLLEAAMMWVLFGNPAARVLAVTGFGGGESAADVLAAYGADATRWTVLARAPQSFLNYRMGAVLITAVLAVPLMCALARERDRVAWRFVGVWMLSLWLPMILAAGLIDPSSPRIRDYHIRYWFLIVPVMFLAAAALVHQLAVWASRWGRRWATITAAVLVVLVLLAPARDVIAVQDTMRFRALGATHPDEVRTWFQTHGSQVDVVWTDSRTVRFLRLSTTDYLGNRVWDGEIRVFDPGRQYRDVSEISGAIVAHELGLRYLRREDRPLPDTYLQLREDWTVDVARADGTLWIAREP